MSNSDNKIMWESCFISENRHPVKKKYKHSQEKRSQKPVNIGGKSLINYLKYYYGVVFVLIIIFVSFITISVSYAKSKEAYDNNVFELNESENQDKILENLLISSVIQKNGNIKKNLNKRYETVKYSKYRLKNKESLVSVAKRFGVTLDTLILSNNLKKINLSSGEIIIIPNQDGRIIKVGRNDNLIKIANRYGVTWESVADANNLKSQVIIPGTNMFIPGSSLTEYERSRIFKKKKNVVTPKKISSKSVPKSSLKILLWPHRGKITSYFGIRRDPFKQTLDFHTGLDIKGDIGAPVKAADEGVVVYVGYTKVYGNLLMIKHANNIITMYGHLNEIYVKKGVTVSNDSIIGTVGNTGRSTGSHLHFEVRKNNLLVDPLKYLK